jgi:ParB family chromosome partitioning protein
MTDRKGGLGRGLAALIPGAPAGQPDTAVLATGPVTAPGSTAPAGGEPTASARGGAEQGAVYREVPIGAITSNPKQPRQVFDEEALAELEHSIREFGLLQPIVVRDLGDARFELVMGERRLRAAQRAGLETLPTIVRQTSDDAMLRDALLENIHRVALNPLEEAAAYQQLLDEFEVSHDQLAGRIGRSRPAITNTVRLLRLPLPVQRRIAAGVLSAGHARALLTMDDLAGQEDLAARIVSEGMSVRAAEEAVTLAKSQAETRPKAGPKRPAQPAELAELAEQLSDQLDTRVTVELGTRKGKMTIDFGSVADLQRIVELIAPDAAPSAR